MRLRSLECDPTLGPGIARGPRDAGHVVDLFFVDGDALVTAMSQTCDGLVLNHMGPGLDGVSGLEALRDARQTVPCPFLTALCVADAKGVGSRAGRDDDPARPFAPGKMPTRVEALPPRPGVAADRSSRLNARDASIARHKRTCARRGQSIELNPAQFLLLEALLQSWRRVQTRAMPRERSWFMNLDLKMNAVGPLRPSIEHPSGDTLIHTNRGAGHELDAA